MEKMFKKIVAVDEVGLELEAYDAMTRYAHEFVKFNDYPDDATIIERMKGADVMLVSWHTTIGKNILQACKDLKYVGMCCSLYDEASANVDIAAAREMNIQVLGVRDYGDEGVAEFVVAQMVQLLHGFGENRWRARPSEITGFKFGLIGLGAAGRLVAKAMQHFGAEIYYYCRTPRDDAESLGYHYLPLNELLTTVDAISTHLPKNNPIIRKKELEIFGNGKIIINTSIGPTYDVDDVKNWLDCKDNYLITDSCGMGAYVKDFETYSNSIYFPIVCADAVQMHQRLSQKVLNNIETALDKV